MRKYALGSYNNEIVILDTKFEPIGRFDAGLRPSYVLWYTDNILLSVNELNKPMHSAMGSINSWSIGEFGFEKIDSISSFGEDPCSLTLSPDKSILIVTNYSSSSISSYKIDNGFFHHIETLTFNGCGSNKDRQECSHPHSCYFIDTNKFLICDLGTDKIMYFSISDEKLQFITDYVLPSGSGPRMVRHFKNDIYVAVLELSSEICFFSLNDGNILQRYSTLAAANENSTASHIEVKDNIVIVSNRGEDSISYIDFSRGLVKTSKTYGKCPRFFYCTSNEIIVLNQDSDSMFFVNSNKIIKMPSPTCLMSTD